MSSFAQIKDPDSVKCTLQFTMLLKDWKQVRDTLGKNATYAEQQLINDIVDLVFQLEKTLYPNPNN